MVAEYLQLNDFSVEHTRDGLSGLSRLRQPVTEAPGIDLVGAGPYVARHRRPGSLPPRPRGHRTIRNASHITSHITSRSAIRNR